MNYILSYTTKAEAKIKKKCRKDLKLREKMEKALNLLSLWPFYKSLNTHKTDHPDVKGKVYSSWVEGNYRLIWDFNEQDKILIYDFDTHNKVYK